LSSQLGKAQEALKTALSEQAKSGTSRQNSLQKLGINLEKTKRFDLRVVVWVLADDVMQNRAIKVESRIKIGIKALNAVAVPYLMAMDDSGAREVLKHYRMLLAEWADKRRELYEEPDEYTIVKNRETVRKRVTAWAERNLIPWMEKIADASWGKANVEPELPIVIDQPPQQTQNPYSLLGSNMIDQSTLDAVAKLAAAQ
jgi:hypothetical protein